MALSPSPVPSLHAQPMPTSLPAAGPTFPPQLAAAPYCGNYYLLWIVSVLCVQSPVLSESLPGSHCVGRSMQQYTVAPHWYSSGSHAGIHWGRRSEGDCWHLLALSDVTRTLCPVLHDSSNSTTDCRTVFFSTLLSITVLPLFLLSSKKHLRCFPKAMVAAQSQFNSLLLWMQILLDFQLMSRINALRPQTGYVGRIFFPVSLPHLLLWDSLFALVPSCVLSFPCTSLFLLTFLPWRHHPQLKAEEL